LYIRVLNIKLLATKVSIWIDKYPAIMTLNNILNIVFSSSSIIPILRELNIRKTGVTGREIARLSGMTHRSALKALENLEIINLVKKQVAGRTYYFTMNREHYLYKKIVSIIFKAEKDILSKISDQISSSLGKYSESIIIYGSVARGDENPESDLDVCIVYKRDPGKIEQRITDLRAELNSVYGVTLAPFIVSVSEFKKRARSGKPPVNNILKEGKIIYGKQFKDILK
jgi:uncharacterized protein